VAELEGLLAGHTAASYLGRAETRSDAAEQRSARARLGRALSFARWLESTYVLRDGWTHWQQEGTLLCRCEDVPWGAVDAAITSGATTVRAVRGVTRCGMGYCQGRTCGPALQLAITARTGRRLEAAGDFDSRTVASPVLLGQVARDSSI
jgi:hypothetical protein